MASVFDAVDETGKVVTGAAVIGASVPRIDGPLKTTGSAQYAADFHFEGLAHAVPVQSTIASGSIKRIDVSVAEKMPGVLLVLHHGNIDKLYRVVPNDFSATSSEARSPFEDEKIYYWGQYVAVVVAETLEQATEAAQAVKVEYATGPQSLNPSLSDYAGKRKSGSKRGDVDGAFASAPFKVDQNYITPVETHNPIEMHATVATWDGENVTLYETSQGVVNHRLAIAQILGVPRENVQVITRFLGSGFGGKLFPWPHSAMAAVAARQLKRPVKLSLSRRMMFSNVGHRPRCEQQIKIGATAEGKLVALRQDYLNHTSFIDEIDEGCGEATPYLYSVPNLEITSALVQRNIGTPSPMRGPGAVPGLFAMESAMDELAIALKMDPVELRLRNEPVKDEGTGQQFSSRHLKECLETGKQKFGWDKRTPAVGSMRRDGKILGWGMAAASWGAYRFGASATVELCANGRVCVRSATQDIGTGTYTIFAQVMQEKLGVPFDRIDVFMGDSSLPEGAMSGGSWATASSLPSISAAATNAKKTLLQLAASTAGSPHENVEPAKLELTSGWVHAADKPYHTGIPFEEVVKLARLSGITGEGKTIPTFEDPKAKDLSLHSYGCQFVEVEWEPEIARLRVSRVVSVIDGGRIINRKAATNQIMGAVVMGVGMGLLEQTVYDQRNGQPINGSMADYLVATCADSPSIDVTFLDHPDLAMNEYGARGVGEIGLAGVAPAITAAVYHATGVRVRELPVRIEDLLKSDIREA
ncbi:xanthine dehydrogenase family protein molybdopterin-binding subunit [Acidicapsa acidisoli]|uniref:xanthine dehydrogenase family protein molybdopterin-binding subunit n=1 Tax=Acidicapsa acidisoli TaxID=1615681 RepID=UPI0021DF750B|nr:xanthine dehydrogenase family protein molybdopterin-binding subunit [Acidicapsa acidisoli]